jgi:hypothetical protein
MFRRRLIKEKLDVKNTTLEVYSNDINPKFIQRQRGVYTISNKVQGERRGCRPVQNWYKIEVFPLEKQFLE